MDLPDKLRKLSGIQPKPKVKLMLGKKTVRPQSFLNLQQTYADCLSQVTNAHTPDERRQPIYNILAGTYFKRCHSLGIDDRFVIESLEAISATTRTSPYCEKYLNQRWSDEKRLKASKN
jgi:hypothetical protein